MVFEYKSQVHHAPPSGNSISNDQETDEVRQLLPVGMLIY